MDKMEVSRIKAGNHAEAKQGHKVKKLKYEEQNLPLLGDSFLWIAGINNLPGLQKIKYGLVLIVTHQSVQGWVPPDLYWDRVSAVFRQQDFNSLCTVSMVDCSL